MVGWKKNVRRVAYSPRYMRDICFCYFHFGRWEPSWRLYGLPIVYRHEKAVISIGSNWVACSSPRHNSLGVFQKVTIKAFPNASLRVGNNVGMSGVSISCSLSIEIGNDVLLGSGAVVTDSDAHPLHVEERHDASKIGKARVVIEDGAFIGARAIVLKGVRVGKGAVVGAGAVVSRDVPPMTVVAGNPAKVAKAIARYGQ